MGVLRLAMVTAFPLEPNVIRGGVESVAATLIIGLQELGGFEIHVVSFAPPNKCGIELRDGITIHWINSGRLPGVLRFWSTERHAIHRCLDTIKPDITHFQGVLAWAINYKNPYVVTIHGIIEKDILYTSTLFSRLKSRIISAAENLIRKRAPHVIIISPYVLDTLKNKIKGKIWHIENPVGNEFFSHQSTATENDVLYVGRLITRKNITGLIDAFHILLKSVPNATLYLGGDTDATEYLQVCQQKLIELNISAQVKFLGNIDRDKLPLLLAQAKCLVLASFQETAPMVIEEALAAGVPVVASNICGIPYLISPGKTGYLVSPNNPQEIATALAKILTDTNTLINMRKNCNEIAIDRFHYLSVARKTINVYTKALNMPPKLLTTTAEQANHEHEMQQKSA